MFFFMDDADTVFAKSNQYIQTGLSSKTFHQSKPTCFVRFQTDIHMLRSESIALCALFNKAE